MMTSYGLPCAAKKVFASSMWMRLRGSSYARALRWQEEPRALDHHSLDLDVIQLL
jgi:hypothetical protein